MRNNIAAAYLSVDCGSESCSDAHAHIESSVQQLMVAAHKTDSGKKQSNGVQVASPGAIVTTRLEVAHESAACSQRTAGTHHPEHHSHHHTRDVARKNTVTALLVKMG